MTKERSDRSAIVTVIIFIVTYTLAVVWWAANINAETEDFAKHIEDSKAVTIEYNQLKVTIAADLATIKAQNTDILRRVEKLDGWEHRK